jgi:hypothetical protein
LEENRHFLEENNSIVSVVDSASVWLKRIGFMYKNFEFVREKMNYVPRFIFLLFICLCHSAYAKNISLEALLSKRSDLTAGVSFVDEQGMNVFAVDKEGVLELVNFKNHEIPTTKKIKTENRVLELLSAGGRVRNSFLAITINEHAVYSLNAIDLKSFNSTVVNIPGIKAINSLHANDGVVVGGQWESGEAGLVILDENLKLLNKTTLLQTKASLVRSVWKAKEMVFAVTEYEKPGGPLTIWQYTSGLQFIRKLQMDGRGAGLTFFKDHLVVAYNNLGHGMAAGFDSKLEREWTQSLYKHVNGSTRRTILNTTDGVYVIGANNDHLLIMRLDAQGKILELIEDKSTGLPPSLAPYAAQEVAGKLNLVGSVIDENDNTKNNTKIMYFKY